MGERVVREGWLAWDDELTETDRGVRAEVSRDVSADVLVLSRLPDPEP